MGTARTVAVFAAVLLLAQPAAALPPGVFVSPGSPAGQQYAFPLSVLRGQATGHTAPAGVPQPLFGYGIHPAAPASSGNVTARRASKPAAVPRHRRGSRPSSASRVGSSQGARSREAALASLVRPSSDVPQIALIAVVLLLVGLAFGAGIAVARRRG